MRALTFAITIDLLLHSDHVLDKHLLGSEYLMFDAAGSQYANGPSIILTIDQRPSLSL